MDIFDLSHKKSRFQKLYRAIAKLYKMAGIAWFLQTVYDMEPYDRQLAELRAMAPGTVGRAIADRLDEHGFRMLPKFDSHDLKHTILGYQMTNLEEVQMQFFLLGNGNYSPVCILPCFVGIFMPKGWRLFLAAFKRGRRAKCILHLTIKGCKEQDLEELRGEYALRADC